MSSGYCISSILIRRNRTFLHAIVTARTAYVPRDNDIFYGISHTLVIFRLNGEFSHTYRYINDKYYINEKYYIYFENHTNITFTKNHIIQKYLQRTTGKSEARIHKTTMLFFISK